MDDRIIDLGEYIRKRGEREDAASRRVFAVWGGEGERSRFALPLWRTAYLAGGSRVAVVWEHAGVGERNLHPLIVLDLATDPARTTVETGSVAGVRNASDPPAVGGRDGQDVAVFLGEREGRRWYLVVTDLDPDREELVGRAREDVLFLAGECAGLLFYRELGGMEPDE